MAKRMKSEGEVRARLIELEKEYKGFNKFDFDSRNENRAEYSALKWVLGGRGGG